MSFSKTKRKGNNKVTIRPMVTKVNMNILYKRNKDLPKKLNHMIRGKNLVK